MVGARSELSWAYVEQCSLDALEGGALQPLKTRVHLVPEGGVEFQVRVLQDVSRKPTFASTNGSNPFLPYEPALYVADVGKSYVALLNKFPVVAQHLLLITRQFEQQQAPLKLSDFLAISSAYERLPGLLFFNGGQAAGASQPHRHMQLVPWPSGVEHGGFPLAQKLLADLSPYRSRVFLAPELLTLERRPQWWLSCYQEGVQSLGLTEGSGTLKPYNLLLTDKLMVMIPRQQDPVEGFSVNALGFAGLLLVNDPHKLSRLRELGLNNLLRLAAQ